VLGLLVAQPTRKLKEAGWKRLVHNGNPQMPELMDKSHEEEEEHKRLMKGEQWRFSSYNVTKNRKIEKERKRDSGFVCSQQCSA
jgi:hypothetical protein